jgi:glycerol-1-phosphatase
VSEPAVARPAPGAQEAGLPRASERPPADVYDTALLDLDGTVYLGGAAVAGAIEALAEARRQGMRLAFVTNNASRTPSAIAAQLNRLGVPADAAEVVTSAQAAARMLAERLPAGSPVLVVGGMGLRIAVRERGLRPVSTALDRPAAVVEGYAPDIGYSLLAEGGLAVRAGAWFVGSNADLTLPTPRGLQPGNGSLLRVIATATGQEPAVAGKPEPPLHAEAMARTGAKRPLVVGDRLDTDIEGAVRARADSMLVLTGAAGPADAVLAPPQQRPTFLARDLSGLLEPHPPVTVAGNEFRCGGWAARLEGVTGTTDGQAAGLEITGAGAAIDGLRALCAAAWSAGAVAADSARSAVGRLHFPG